MKPQTPQILVINGGSSSLKFALFVASEPSYRLGHGTVDRIGLSGTTFSFSHSDTDAGNKIPLEKGDLSSAVHFLIDWFDKNKLLQNVVAIGHRVVHGMQHSAPEIITAELLTELRSISPMDPIHMPGEIELIVAFGKRYPNLPQIACFDTSFHQTMPRIAKQLPIPRIFDSKGIQRYGFHGLSYAYLMEQLGRIGDPSAKNGRVILAHLGSGASMAAVLDGKSVDTSMCFTPTSGLVMGTRSGDLDPGLAGYFVRSENMSIEQFNRMINKESGLLGVSEISSDMRDLLAKETSDVRASEAISLFCYQAKKYVGAYTAALGGLNTLLFAGGIGEKSPVVRSRICEGLGYLGIDIDEVANCNDMSVISTRESRVIVRVMHTDEEKMIARSVSRILGFAAKEEH